MTLTSYSQLLEGVGAISTAESKKAMSHGYQGAITDPLGRDFDDDAVGRYNDDEDSSGSILSAVGKAGAIIWLVNSTNVAPQLRKIIRAIRSSPQRKRTWLSQVDPSSSTHRNNHRALMPILDVKTRWSSTHQMMRKLSIYVAW